MKRSAMSRFPSSTTVEELTIHESELASILLSFPFERLRFLELTRLECVPAIPQRSLKALKEVVWGEGGLSTDSELGRLLKNLAQAPNLQSLTIRDNSFKTIVDLEATDRFPALRTIATLLGKCNYLTTLVSLCRLSTLIAFHRFGICRYAFAQPSISDRFRDWLILSQCSAQLGRAWSIFIYQHTAYH